MMLKDCNLVIIGFMGTGKTSIGKAAASKLGFDFSDIDNIIEERLNTTISEIFSNFGEQHFRKIESETIAEYAQKTGQVISTGGGAVINQDNISNLREKGFIVLIKAQPEIILRNVSNDGNRPLLNCDDPKSKILELLEKRKEFYANNDYEIDISDYGVEEASEKIVKAFLERINK